MSNYLQTIKLKQRFAKLFLVDIQIEKNRRESSTSAGNRLVRVASRCTMHYRCNAGPHTHTWRENGGRGGVDSIFPSLSRSLLSLLLSDVNPSCHPWVQPLSSLKRATSIPRQYIDRRPSILLSHIYAWPRGNRLEG